MVIIASLRLESRSRVSVTVRFLVLYQWLYARDVINSIAPSLWFIKSVEVRIILEMWFSIHIREIGRMSNVYVGGPRATPGCSSGV
jgi:hypothetical protein